MGKVLAQTKGEIKWSANTIDYYADNGEKISADKHLNPELVAAFNQYSPSGALYDAEN